LRGDEREVADMQKQPMDDRPHHLGTDVLRKRLNAIECEIDAARYRPGPWDALIRVIRSQPDTTRTALADDISRVSRKLHLRSSRRTVKLATAITTELAATAIGGILLALALKSGSEAAAITTMIIWVSTLQPLVKLAVGALSGVRYDYGYLYGLEPRFKMKYGSYVSAPRWKRIAFHASGMVGSPLGAILVVCVADDTLQVARSVSLAVFWIVLAINLMSAILALFGVRRLGRLRLADGSGGALGLELREAFGDSYNEN
jgi:hypothetical protein